MPRTLRLVFLLAFTVALETANADIIGDRPDAIVCSVKDPTGLLPWEDLVFFVSAHTRDGKTLYKTLTSDPVVLIVVNSGVIEAQNLADCDGRNVNDLLDAGRAFHLTIPTPRQAK